MLLPLKLSYSFYPPPKIYFCVHIVSKEFKKVNIFCHLFYIFCLHFFTILDFFCLCQLIMLQGLMAFSFEKCQKMETVFLSYFYIIFIYFKSYKLSYFISIFCKCFVSFKLLLYRFFFYTIFIFLYKS